MEASSAQRNVELTQRGFDAYNAGDYESLVALLHPDVELHADPELLNSGDFRGRDSFIKWNAQWIEAWDELHIDPRSVETFGDHDILADAHQIAKGAGSGVSVEMDVFWALEAEDGFVRRMHLYASRERALAAIRGWSEERKARGDT